MRLWLLLIPMLFHPRLAPSQTTRATPMHPGFVQVLHPPPVVSTPRVVPVPKVAASAPSPPLTFQTLPWPWPCITFRESTWNLAAVNPASGDQGAFQFALGTWKEYAPAGYPSQPTKASLSQQLTVAKHIAAVDGYSPWVTARLCGA